MKLYVIAGESSGDAHAAALMKELLGLVPDIEFYGAGGPMMREVGGSYIFQWTQEAVLGLWDVLMKYPYFRTQFYRMFHEIAQLQPDAVIFVDYPGFNLRLASYLHRKGFRKKKIYYISPQVWAWNRGRIPRMAKFLDLMMCIFPFEKPLYEASGLRTEFVGHPMLARLEKRRILGGRDPKLIGLLPGSREREVRRIFPIMLEAATILRKKDPSLRFEASAASEKMAALIKKTAKAKGFAGIPIAVHDAAGLMQRAAVGMVASGTATMEASFFRFPFVLLYKVSWLTFIPGRLLVKVRHLGMPNILAGRTMIPEFIQHQARPTSIADAVWELYRSESARSSMIKGMDEIILQLAEVDAGRRAAEVVLHELNRKISLPSDATRARSL
ncbi:MAG: lipid-A-disaccharide synthase [Verrucomicrobia bacterium]|nr:lipid-A-disaccharide synthase [Verrucomicrobiota bacterium]